MGMRFFRPAAKGLLFFLLTSHVKTTIIILGISLNEYEGSSVRGNTGFLEEFVVLRNSFLLFYGLND